MRRAGHDGVVAEHRVGVGVLDHHRRVVGHDMGADRQVAGRLGHGEGGTRGEHLALGLHQAHERALGARDGADKLRHGVEHRVGLVRRRRGAEGGQRVEPRRLVEGNRVGLHRSSAVRRPPSAAACPPLGPLPYPGVNDPRRGARRPFPWVPLGRRPMTPEATREGMGEPFHAVFRRLPTRHAKGTFEWRRGGGQSPSTRTVRRPRRPRMVLRTLSRITATKMMNACTSGWR